MTKEGAPKSLFQQWGKSREYMWELGRQSNWSKTISGIMVSNIQHLYETKLSLTEQLGSLTKEAINDHF